MKQLGALQWLALMLVVLGLSVGQILFKLAAGQISGLRSALQSALSGWLLLALVVYGLATVLWVHTLRSVPLRIAYPFVALAYVVVPLLGWMWLHEPIAARTLVGAAIILVGVWVSVA